MICIKCNSNISRNSNFCPNCGTKVSKNEITTENKTKSTPIISPLLIIIIAGVLSILGVILILDSNIPEQKVSNNITNQPNQKMAEVLSKIEFIENELDKHPDDIKLNLELANNLFDVQLYRKAIPHYYKVLEHSPENAEVRIDLAVSYYNLQIFDTAFVEIEKALKINPDHEQGLYNLGVMHYNSGSKEKAKEIWNKLIMLYDGSQSAETAKQLLKNI